MCKAQCVLRGDFRESYEDFDLENIYASVAAHKKIQMIPTVASTQNLILEAIDIDHAYLYALMFQSL